MCGSDKLQIKLKEEQVSVRCLAWFVATIVMCLPKVLQTLQSVNLGAAQGRFPVITLVSYACAECIEKGMHL